MKRYIVRHILIAKLAALAMLTVCFVQPPVGAHALETAADPMPSPAYQGVSGCEACFDLSSSFGFVPGQTLRVTVAHVSGQTGQEQSPPNVRVGVWLLDSSGRVIAQSAQAPIPLNEFRFFDFNRAALNLPGELGTGRLQVRARLVMDVAAPYEFTDDPKATSLLLPSLEVVDNGTGRTAAAMSCTNNLKQIGLALH